MVLSVICAGRHHQPYHPRRLQFGDHLLERGRGLRALLFQQRAGRRGRIVADDLVTAAHQPLRHVRAHAAETNHCNFHTLQPVYRAEQYIGRRGISRIRGALSMVITAGLPTASNRPVKVSAPLSALRRNEVIESPR